MNRYHARAATGKARSTPELFFSVVAGHRDALEA
jgi:hypothetical protein